MTTLLLRPPADTRTRRAHQQRGGFHTLTPTPQAQYAPNAGIAASAGSVPATGLTGTLTLGQLPGGAVTNNANGVNLSGSFTFSCTIMRLK